MSDKVEQTYMELTNELNTIIETFSSNFGYLTLSLVTDDGVEADLVEELRAVLRRYSQFAQISSVRAITTYESCGYDTGVVSIAFTNPYTGLETYLLQWERA